MTVGYPPWPNTVATSPGTEAWAREQVALLNYADARAITDLVGIGLVPYVSPWRARTHYARVCHERCWSGPFARHVWTVIEALLKAADPMDNDIPF